MNQNNKPLVSVVVPVYNVEKYLRKCIESIIHQTLENIEIILVDDGSTDGSGNICDEYLTDPRVKVLHKSNGGLSDARNVGVSEATADYVGFVDSDDYIENDMYELLYENIIEENADISACCIYDVYATGVKPHFSETEGKFITDAKGAIELSLCGKHASLFAVNKLYRRKLLSAHPFLIGKTYEDAHFIIPYLVDINKAVFDMAPKYYYVHRADTISTKVFESKDMSIVEAHKNNMEIIKNQYPELIEVAKFRYFWSLFYVLDKMLETNSFGEEDEFSEIVSLIRKNYFKIMSNHYVGKARKLSATGLMIHRNLYKICLNAYVHRQKKQLVDD